MTFLKLNFNMDVEQFRDAKFWMKMFNEMIGTAVWIMVNQKMAGTFGMWSLGLSYLIVQSAIGGSFNALSSFNKFLLVVGSIPIRSFDMDPVERDRQNSW